MNINKFITESIDNTDNDELAVSDDETAFSDTLLQLSLPAAISAGLGALNLRKVESGEIYEVDWEEVADKAGTIAKQVGKHTARKISDMSDDVRDFGTEFATGVKKVAKRAAEDVSDKFQGKGPISGLVKKLTRSSEDDDTNTISSIKKFAKTAKRSIRDKIENFDSKKFADNMRASDSASPYHLVPKK